MSRSYKKHYSSTFACYFSDKPWRKQWHSIMRARERDLFRLQLTYPEDDYCYPIPREADNIYNAPSDGGSHWRYSDFEHFFFEITHAHWRWTTAEILPREEAWKEWITKYMGK